MATWRQEVAGGATDGVVDREADLAARARKLVLAARALIDQGTHWAEFYCRVLGQWGMVHRVFPTPEARAYFERSPAYEAIQRMLASLRWKGGVPGEAAGTPEVTRVITVRLPASVHEDLRAEAAVRGVSLDQLCVSKLLEWLPPEALPAQSPSGQWTEADQILEEMSAGEADREQPAESAAHRWPWECPEDPEEVLRRRAR